MLEDLAANWPYFIMMGLAAGFTSALLGIGGGVILVPLLILITSTSQHQAQGFSLGYMILTALAGFLYYRYQHQVKLDFRVVMLLTAGGVLGAFVGALAARHIPAFWLQKLFAVLMVAVALRLFLKGPQSEDQKPGPTRTPAVSTQTEAENP